MLFGPLELREVSSNFYRFSGVKRVGMGSFTAIVFSFLVGFALARALSGER